MPAFTCSGWRRLLTAATELDEYLPAIAVGIGCMTPYIDLALLINPSLITGTTG